MDIKTLKLKITNSFKNKPIAIATIVIASLLVITFGAVIVKYIQDTNTAAQKAKIITEADSKLKDIIGLDSEQIKYLIDNYPGLLVPGTTPSPFSSDQLQDARLIDIIKKLNNRTKAGVAIKSEYFNNPAVFDIPYFLPYIQENSKNENLYLVSNIGFKTATWIDGKLSNYLLETNQYFLDYYGGKYAIKSLLKPSDTYISANIDPDVQLLVQIIYGKDLKELGRQKAEDGKSYLVFEAPAYIIHNDTEDNPDFNNYYYSFYLNPEDYAISKQILTKGRNGDQGTITISTQNILEKKYFTQDELATAMQASELVGIQIKEFPYDPADYGSQVISLESYMKKKDLYYIDFPSMFLGHVIDMGNEVIIPTALQTARNTTDYDPNYTPADVAQMLPADEFTPISLYYQGEDKFPILGYEIYNQAPKTNPETTLDKPISQHNLTLNYNGQVIEGLYQRIDKTMILTGEDINYIDCSITFKAENGFYYVIRQTFNPQTDDVNSPSMLDKESFSLSKLDITKAKEFDTKKFTDFE